MTPQTEPLCPQCQGPMAKRTSARGEFWGCRRFPACRGTRQVGQETRYVAPTKQYEPIPLLPGSEEQEAIWDYQLNGSAHMVVNAAPGSGKTWTMTQYCLRKPAGQKILFVAFNKHIAAEAQGKLRASGCVNVEARTYHSFGNQIIRDAYPKSQIRDDKVTGILERIHPAPLYNKAEWRRTLNLAKKLVSLAKNYGTDYQGADFISEMERVADYHALDASNGNLREAISLVVPAMEESKKTAGIDHDFDDMIWLPVALDLSPLLTYDMVICDEVQDLNVIQHDLTFRAVYQPVKSWDKKSPGRIVVVGDTRQSIYSFRGASTESIELLSARLGKTPQGVREFPLTITRRCPKSHVMLAQTLYPEHIRALDDAPMGEILQVHEDAAIEMMQPGDMVVCRVNAKLIPTAYALIRRGIRPVVKGRDIGEGLISLLDRLEEMMEVHPGAGSETMWALGECLSIYCHEKEQELLPLGDKAEGRIAALRDKCDCMQQFINGAKSIPEIRQQIESLFSDENISNAVTLGTVHRTKGLEAERVFVLAPDLIPHPMARRPHEREQETHIAWIAATRAKFDRKTGAVGTIVFCGPVPLIYTPKQPLPPLETPLPLSGAEIEGDQEPTLTLNFASEGSGVGESIPPAPEIVPGASKPRSRGRYRAARKGKSLETVLRGYSGNPDAQHSEEDDDEPPF